MIKILIKNKSLLFILVSIFITVLGKGQVTTAKIQHITDDDPVEIPVKYIGFSNICYQKRAIDYQQYLGLKAYLIKGALDLSESQYFTITKIDIIKRGSAELDEEDGLIPADDLLITLKSDDAKDSLEYKTTLIHNHQYHLDGYYNNSRFDYLILVPYFLKEKELHDGEKYVLVNKGGCFYDEAREELFTYDKPLYGGIWKCEVNMYVTNKEDGLERLTYLFKDTLGQVIAKDIQIVKELDGGEFYYVYYAVGSANTTHFMPLKIFEAIVNESKKRNSRITSNNLKTIKELTAKYGNENVQLILHGKIKIGMNEQMCAIAWSGLYAIISRVQNNSGTLETWQHALYGTKLYFKNGKLYKIVD